mmetsp:Transcript_23387/g.39384  ORF Transcript_23387/g.39384 Transcript_23387/m.39384 type:complete len:1157 (+) Transcript_23387:2390-5860(+)
MGTGASKQRGSHADGDNKSQHCIPGNSSEGTGPNQEVPASSSSTSSVQVSSSHKFKLPKKDVESRPQTTDTLIINDITTTPTPPMASQKIQHGLQSRSSEQSDTSLRILRLSPRPRPEPKKINFEISSITEVVPNDMKDESTSSKIGAEGKPEEQGSPKNHEPSGTLKRESLLDKLKGNYSEEDIALAVESCDEQEICDLLPTLASVISTLRPAMGNKVISILSQRAMDSLYVGQNIAFMKSLSTNQILQTKTSNGLPGITRNRSTSVQMIPPKDLTMQSNLDQQEDESKQRKYNLSKNESSNVAAVKADTCYGEQIKLKGWKILEKVNVSQDVLDSLEWFGKIHEKARTGGPIKSRRHLNPEGVVYHPFKCQRIASVSLLPERGKVDSAHDWFRGSVLLEMKPPKIRPRGGRNFQLVNLLEAGALKHLTAFLESPNPVIKRESFGSNEAIFIPMETLLQLSRELSAFRSSVSLNLTSDATTINRKNRQVKLLREWFETKKIKEREQKDLVTALQLANTKAATETQMIRMVFDRRERDLGLDKLVALRPLVLIANSIWKDMGLTYHSTSIVARIARATAVRKDFVCMEPLENTIFLDSILDVNHVTDLDQILKYPNERSYTDLKHNFITKNSWNDLTHGWGQEHADRFIASASAICAIIWIFGIQNHKSTHLVVNKETGDLVLTRADVILGGMSTTEIKLLGGNQNLIGLQEFLKVLKAFIGKCHWNPFLDLVPELVLALRDMKRFSFISCVSLRHLVNVGEKLGSRTENNEHKGGIPVCKEGNETDVASETLSSSKKTQRSTQISDNPDNNFHGAMTMFLEQRLLVGLDRSSAKYRISTAFNKILQVDTVKQDCRKTIFECACAQSMHLSGNKTEPNREEEMLQLLHTSPASELMLEIPVIASTITFWPSEVQICIKKIIQRRCASSQAIVQAIEFYFQSRIKDRIFFTSRNNSPTASSTEKSLTSPRNKSLRGYNLRSTNPDRQSTSPSRSVSLKGISKLRRKGHHRCNSSGRSEPGSMTNIFGLSASRTKDDEVLLSMEGKVYEDMNIFSEIFEEIQEARKNSRTPTPRRLKRQTRAFKKTLFTFDNDTIPQANDSSEGATKDDTLDRFTKQTRQQNEGIVANDEDTSVDVHDTKRIIRQVTVTGHRWFGEFG